jgi:osmotically-inducible protein OsmY
MDMTTATMVHRDQEIQQDVLAELRWDLGVAASEIGVAVKDGVVTLTGHVDTSAKKWRAEEAALRVNGVAAVANNIEVRLVNGDITAVAVNALKTDDDIAAAAVNALNWNSMIPLNKVRVTVEKGWVTLRGEVEWQYQRQEAERTVRSLWGVKGVTNLITIKPAASPTDLKKKIEDALVRSAQVEANAITVSVQGSTAILRGKVHSWAEKREAERAAWLAPGITSVDNQISVSTF